METAVTHECVRNLRKLLPQTVWPSHEGKLLVRNATRDTRSFTRTFKADDLNENKSVALYRLPGYDS
jgi:hypothetical protein